MTNLTEQYRNGELPKGLYYVKAMNYYTGEQYQDIDMFDGNCWKRFAGVTEVFAKVPSYEQWEKFRNALADNQIENSNLLIENTKLKSLLKECRDEIEYLRKHYKGNIDHLKNNTRLDKEINQVLGE